MLQQDAVSVALHMILNLFFKLYDLNGDNCTKNIFFSTEYCFCAVLMLFKELAVKIKTAE